MAGPQFQMSKIIATLYFFTNHIYVTAAQVGNIRPLLLLIELMHTLQILPQFSNIKKLPCFFQTLFSHINLT